VAVIAAVVIADGVFAALASLGVLVVSGLLGWSIREQVRLGQVVARIEERMTASSAAHSSDTRVLDRRVGRLEDILVVALGRASGDAPYATPHHREETP
jgi:hypothetical protein